MALTGRLLADFSDFQRAVQQAEVSLRGMETGAGKVETSLNRMSDSLSGRRLIQDATLTAEAVERIGGTSKLTQAELTRVGATATEAAEKMKAMGVEVPPSIQRIVDAVKPVPEQLTLADRAVGVLKSSFGQFTAANLAATAIQSFVSHTSDMIGLGMQLPVVSGAFDRLTSSVGETGRTMLTVTRTATQGLVTDMDLMLATNKAILLGLPVTSDEMGTMAKAAVTLGRAMGQDAQKSLDDMITALGRSSPLILDNLGLTVKVGEANEVYAATLGKTSNQLTDAEKKMAFYRAAMEAAERKTKEIGATSGSAAESVTRLRVAWDNLLQQTGKAAGQSGLGTFLEVPAAVIRSWNEWFEAVDDTNKAFVRTHGETAKVDAELTDLEATLRKVTGAAKALPEPFRAMGMTAEEITRVEEKLTKTAEASIKVHEAERDLFGTEVIEKAALYRDVISDMGGKMPPLAAGQKQVADAMKEALTVMRATGQGASDLAVQFERIMRTVTGLNDDGTLKAMNLNIANLMGAPKAAVDDITQSMLNNAHATSQMAQDAEAWDREIQDFNSQVGNNITIIGGATQAVGATTAQETARMAMGWQGVASAASAAAASINAIGSTFDAQQLVAAGVIQHGSLSGIEVHHGIFGGARAGGGPVSPGMSYLVGESGPELYTPSASGMISPLGGGGIHLTLNITQPLGTPQAIYSVVEGAVTTALRRQGIRLPRA